MLQIDICTTEHMVEVHRDDASVQYTYKMLHVGLTQGALTCRAWAPCMMAELAMISRWNSLKPSGHRKLARNGKESRACRFNRAAVHRQIDVQGLVPPRFPVNLFDVLFCCCRQKKVLLCSWKDLSNEVEMGKGERQKPICSELFVLHALPLHC